MAPSIENKVLTSVLNRSASGVLNGHCIKVTLIRLLLSYSHSTSHILISLRDLSSVSRAVGPGSCGLYDREASKMYGDVVRIDPMSCPTFEKMLGKTFMDIVQGMLSSLKT
jgi:hypothetical protein